MTLNLSALPQGQTRAVAALISGERARTYTEAAKMVVGILERVAKINGLIPDKSLVTIDQRARKFDQPITFKIDGGIDELAKKAWEG